MNKVLIIAGAIGAALMLSAPVSAREGHGHAYGHGYHHGYVKTVKVMPMRSNQYGYRRGHARADYVHSMNHSRRYHY